MTTNTIRLHRVLRAAPERIYRAFLDADAMAKWLPPTGSPAKSTTWMRRSAAPTKCPSPTSPPVTGTPSGESTSSWCPNERIRHTDKFDDPNLPGEMQTTISLKQVFCGTELTIVQEGIPAAIPPEACYLGWQESLALLAQLVEAEIPD